MIFDVFVFVDDDIVVMYDIIFDSIDGIVVEVLEVFVYFEVVVMSLLLVELVVFVLSYVL